MNQSRPVVRVVVRELDWAERLHYLGSAWYRDVESAPGPASTYCRQHQRLHSLVRYCRESAIEIIGGGTLRRIEATDVAKRGRALRSL